MFRTLWHWILRLFGFDKTVTSDRQQETNAGYTRGYEDIENINFTAIISNNLATLTVSESNIDVTGDNQRARLLDDVSKRLWRKMKKITSRTFGTGGCIVIPYVTDGRIYFDIISQDRLNVNAKRRQRNVLPLGNLQAGGLLLYHRKPCHQHKRLGCVYRAVGRYKRYGDNRYRQTSVCLFQIPRG